MTALLGAWRDGDDGALEELTPLVYRHLHRLAIGYMSREPGRHGLQATELVNEAFMRLVGSEVHFRDREHFFALSARLMRRVLVDFARRRAAEKRGGGVTAVTLDEERMTPLDQDALLALDEALDALESYEPRQSQMVELRYFAGMTAAEISSFLKVSTATVERDLRAARAWLQIQLGSAAAR
ncbi:MAG: ECF-type sigma factor [Acidobacteriota bacterium]